jgi:hypothetical protein
MMTWIIRTSGSVMPLIVRADSAAEALEKVSGRWFSPGIQQVQIEAALDTETDN